MSRSVARFIYNKARLFFSKKLRSNDMSDVLNRLKQFRERLYSLLPYRRDALFNLLDALTSRGHESKSIVELSEAKVFERQYSSITDAIADGLPKASFDRIEQTVFEATNGAGTEHVFFTDCTSNPRPWARTLTEKGIVHAPNPAPGNKPICVGHQYSVLAMSPSEDEVTKKHWLIPLSVERIKQNEKGNERGMQQIIEHIAALGLDDELSISVGDSLYGSERCRSIASSNKNLVHVFRISNSRNLFHQPTADEFAIKGAGRKKTYGSKMDLSDPTTYKEPDSFVVLDGASKKKVLVIEISQWNNLLIRGSREFSSACYPVNLVRIIVKNEQGESVFKRPLWIGVMGKRRHEVDSHRTYLIYRQRYDIEHFFRFGKQKLLLDSYQTPETEHEELWWKFAPLAYIQLYLAAQAGHLVPKPWERYLPAYKVTSEEQSSQVKTPSQTQRIFENILEQIGTPAKSSVTRGKPVGRMAGDKPTAREQSPIHFKSNKKASCSNESINVDPEKAAKNSEAALIDKLLNDIKAKLKLAKITPQDFAEKLLL